MAQLVEEIKEYAIYLKGIKLKNWTRHVFLVHRWLYNTSNVSKSVNSL